MRKLLALPLFATACTNVPINGPTYDSVRERLTEAPTSLYVHDETSSGSITARRRVGDGWDSGTTAMTIERGYVRTAIDGNGRLAIQRLELDLAPIQLGVFEKPTQLQDVHVRLAKPVQAEAVWRSEDEATAVISMPFEFDWSIKFVDDEQPYPLATQHLPPTNVAVSLDGSGDHVGARIDIDASGELWNWADLIQITDISASLDAESAD